MHLGMLEAVLCPSISPGPASITPINSPSNTPNVTTPGPTLTSTLPTLTSPEPAAAIHAIAAATIATNPPIPLPLPRRLHATHALTNEIAIISPSKHTCVIPGALPFPTP